MEFRRIFVCGYVLNLVCEVRPRSELLFVFFSIGAALCVLTYRHVLRLIAKGVCVNTEDEPHFGGEIGYSAASCARWLPTVL